MSHSKISSFSFKENLLTITSASSNIVPKIYSSYTFTHFTTKEDAASDFIFSIWDGCYELNSSTKNNWAGSIIGEAKNQCISILDGVVYDNTPSNDKSYLLYKLNSFILCYYKGGYSSYLEKIKENKEFENLKNNLTQEKLEKIKLILSNLIKKLLANMTKEDKKEYFAFDENTGYLFVKGGRHGLYKNKEDATKKTKYDWENYFDTFNFKSFNFQLCEA